jgi:hypothetical protein
LRALQNQIYAQQDLAAATDVATAAAQAAAQVAASIASERAGLNTQLMNLQGDTAGLRAQELAGLDSSNRALQTRIYAMQDAQAADALAAQQQAQAMQDAQQAAQAAAQAASQLKDAWSSVTDSIVAEINRIRGLNGGSSQSLSGAQAQFAITSAQARSGDMEAAKLLPQLSQSLLALAEASAANTLDLQRIQAITASSLGTTASSIAGRAGIALPSFAVGTDYVPQDQLAQIHKGERITPAAYNRSDSTNADLAAEIRGLRQVNQEMAADMRKMKDTLVNVTRGGEAMQTEVAV